MAGRKNDVQPIRTRFTNNFSNFYLEKKGGHKPGN